MRIVLHDYAGHPFQVQLSRELARRGHELHHLYFASDVTPRGALAPRPGDPPGLAIRGIDIAGRFDKFSYWKRAFYNRAYGRQVADAIDAIAPDLVINTNVPLDALDVIQRRCAAPGRRFVAWVQDVFSQGVRNVLRRRLPVAGAPIAWRYARLERAILRRADHIVSITDDFVPLFAGWGIPPERISVIENWAPLDELAPYAGERRWLCQQGLEGRRIILYSGTLGLKHDPGLLLEAARQLRDRPDVAVIVISEGAGAAWLRERLAAESLPNLRLLPFQPYERLAEILSSASILVALLEADAGVFCVPSKVLSYLCVGRPILLAAPHQNLAARTVLRARAGRVVPPGAPGTFAAAARAMLESPGELERCGRQGRRYAQATFEIEGIADRFERLWEPGAAVADRRLAA